MVQHDVLRPEHDRLILKLDRIARLSAEDRTAIEHLPMRVANAAPDQDLFREGDRPIECCLILSGFACRYKLLSDGKRQITSIQIPGDMPDLHGLHMPILDDSLVALAATRIAFIPHECLNALCRQRPSIAAILWRETLVDAAIFREWMVGMGRRSAYQRIAHLFCELNLRLAAVGLSHAHSYEMPATQAELGDMAGLSTVHVNRVLQELRGNGLIRLEGARLAILDWEGLQEAGLFDPIYLHLDRAAVDRLPRTVPV